MSESHGAGGSAHGSGAAAAAAAGPPAVGSKCAVWHCGGQREYGRDVCAQCARIRNVGWRALARAYRAYGDALIRASGNDVDVWDLIPLQPPSISEALFTVHTAHITVNPFKRVMGDCTVCGHFHPYLQVVPEVLPPGTPPGTQPVTHRMCEACMARAGVEARDANNNPRPGFCG